MLFYFLYPLVLILNLACLNEIVSRYLTHNETDRLHQNGLRPVHAILYPSPMCADLVLKKASEFSRFSAGLSTQMPPPSVLCKRLALGLPRNILLSAVGPHWKSIPRVWPLADRDPPGRTFRSKSVMSRSHVTPEETTTISAFFVQK